MTKLYIVTSGVDAEAGPPGRFIGVYTDAVVAKAVQVSTSNNGLSTTSR
jgi:hypothetical protein